MKVVSAAEMARVERLAYADGASEEEFMERAGRGIAHAVAEWIVRRDILHQVYLLCGKGNNGGDAYVAGRYLLQKGFKVTALQIGSGEETSALS
ncbi:MAG: hypothetical protein KDK78_12445 [Chlamydiia bacterium]|nr:hypothetical protein [Chlamydiia bacterium]